jgi:hypothetical protein
MADQGKSYRDILRFYYTDVSLQQLDGVDRDPVDAPVARTPPPPDDDTPAAVSDAPTTETTRPNDEDDTPRTTRRIGW